jgi:hypothetical protein
VTQLMTVFCEHLVIDQPQTGTSGVAHREKAACGGSGQAAWTVHYVHNHTLLGNSPPASQAGRRVGPIPMTAKKLLYSFLVL